MKNLNELIEQLNQILRSKGAERKRLITVFQDELWNGDHFEDEMINELLTEIAYDLDFYEPNDEWRKESSSFYGDDMLEDFINLFLKSISEIQSRAPGEIGIRKHG